ncbi:unnamed protein product [Effrenium voratum]|uniref:Uncharacterized protein n=1 Tax=Effrenium voratum TaxID=2562239 RepID=A0AA36I0Y6_9DINO|nr:unnamed protein product [Effrenium voratum]
MLAPTQYEGLPFVGHRRLRSFLAHYAEGHPLTLVPASPEAVPYLDDDTDLGEGYEEAAFLKDYFQSQEKAYHLLLNFVIEVSVHLNYWLDWATPVHRRPRWAHQGARKLWRAYLGLVGWRRQLAQPERLASQLAHLSEDLCRLLAYIQISSFDLLSSPEEGALKRAAEGLAWQTHVAALTAANLSSQLAPADRNARRRSVNRHVWFRQTLPDQVAALPDRKNAEVSEEALLAQGRQRLRQSRLAFEVLVDSLSGYLERSGQPGHFQKWWPIYGLAGLFLLGHAWRLRLSDRVAREALLLRATDVCWQFLDEWVVSPFKQLWEALLLRTPKDELRVQLRDLKVEQEALERMVQGFASFARQEPHFKHVQPGNDQVLPELYFEWSMTKPISNVVTGHLVESCMVQSQKLKVLLYASLYSMDAVMMQLKWDFILAGAMPTTMLCGLVYWAIASTRRRRQLDSRKKMVRALSELDKFLNRNTESLAPRRQISGMARLSSEEMPLKVLLSQALGEEVSAEELAARPTTPLALPCAGFGSVDLDKAGRKAGVLAYKVHTQDPNLTQSAPEVPPVLEVPLHAQLAAAIPLVTTNLTNYTGLIADRAAPPNPNITYHFGFLASDLAVLSDKVSGFYIVLHEMLGEEGPKLCPLNKQSHIKECLKIAMCLLQEHVPEDMELPQYTTYLELVTAFVEVGWPVLKRNLLLEEPTPMLHEDDVAPAQYQCDELQHPEEPFGHAFLDLGSKASRTLAMSAALSQASKTTFQVLDAHEDNKASVDATVQKLHQVWHSFCKELGCDHSNFWDIHFSSHQQTTALMKLESAAHVRAEVQQRARLHKRVLRFVEENHVYYGQIRNSSSPGRKFLDPAFIQASSRKAWQRYAEKGRRSMISFVMPVMRNLASSNETRALQLLDQVEFRKFQQQQARRRQTYEEPVEPDMPDVDMQEQESDAEVSLIDDSEEDEDEEEPMYLQVTESGEAELESETDAESGRRRRRRRRWIGGRRRRRHRRRIFEAAVAAVAKVVEDVVEFMASALACIGTAAEFTSTGYSYEVVPGAVSLSMGLSSGSGQSLDKLVQGQPPVAFISLDFGFAVGATAKLTWTGVGLGGGVGCNVAGCTAYIVVALIGSVNIPMVTAACPFGATLGSATCAQAFGGGISQMCCNMNLQTGGNDCR